MEYPRFERLVIGGMALLVVFTLAVSFVDGAPDAAEIVGQLALVVVMAVAVHWGRKMGTFAALGACLLYLAMRLPLLAAGLSPHAFVLIVSRFAGYCLIGIAGGELFGRVKYIFAGSTQSDVVDSWSQVFNQRHIARTLTQALELHRRYQEPFSVVVIAVNPSHSTVQRPEKLRGFVRAVAGHLRDEVRMVDDVARLDDGRYVVLLSHTPDSVAPVVADRLSSGLHHTLGLPIDSIVATCLGTDKSMAELEAFVANLTPTDLEATAQPASGE